MTQVKKKSVFDSEVDEIMAKKFSIPVGLSPTEAVAKLGCYNLPGSDPDFGADYKQLLVRYEELEQQLQVLIPEKAMCFYQELLETMVDISSIEQIASFRKGLKSGYKIASFYNKAVGS